MGVVTEALLGVDGDGEIDAGGALAAGLTTLGFVDVNGILRGKAYTPSAFERICRRGHAAFTDLLLALDPLDEPITSFEDIGIRSGAADLHVAPLKDTLCPLGAGRRLCLGDVRWRDGSPCELSARRVLESALERLGGLGLQVRAAFEYEFRLLEAGRPLTDGLSYSARQLRAAEPFLSRLAAAGERMGLAFEAAHTEAGPGLFEVNVEPADGVAAADRAVLLRHAIRDLAEDCGLTAVFLAKPREGEEGSSGHLHISLWSDGGNAFPLDDGGRPNDLAASMVGGLVAHAGAMSLLMNPTVNSYKRLIPGYFAPVNASWGVENRSAAVRVIPDGSGAGRIELRRPGADSNPYLALAGAVTAIALGLAGRTALPAAVTGDATEAPSPALPTSLEAAIAAFEADDAFRSSLGERFSAYFAETRRWELAAWQRVVTDWEVGRYGAL